MIGGWLENLMIKNMNEGFKRLQVYFKKFIEDPQIQDELKFCLTQSQVELFVRSKFAFWVHKKFPSSFILIETKRIDLVLQIEGYKYCIEFGHQINLLKPKPIENELKISEDCKKLPGKLKNLSKEIDGFDIADNLCCITISLFSDFHLVKIKNKIMVKFFLDNPDHQCGVLAKYGKKVSGKTSDEYFNTYKDKLNDYNSHVLIDETLTFHWRLKECVFNK